MSWSINEVVRMTGLTARTLRHYDAIGLLRPTWTADGGRRHYGSAELLRLQEILLLRQLGLGLQAIADLLVRRSDGDRVALLEEHRVQLQCERDRYDRLIRTVTRTIQSIQEGHSMQPDEMFDGLIHDPYEAEARERWGNAAVDQSHDRLRRLPREDRELLTSGRGFAQVHARLGELKAQGRAVDDPQVQEAVAEHYRVVCLAWTPDAGAYIRLGEMYVEDQRFRHNIGQGDDGLVSFLRDAMTVYAEAKLRS